MKKTFLIFGVAALMSLTACSNKNSEATEDSIELTDSLEQALDTTTVAEADAEAQEAKLPENITSAADLEKALKDNNYSLNDKGDVVDATGKVVMNYADAVKAYGKYYATVAESFGKKTVEDATNAVTDATKDLKEKGEKALNDAKDKAKDKVNEAVDNAKDKASKEVEKAKDKAAKEVDKATDKAAKEVDKLLKK